MKFFFILLYLFFTSSLLSQTATKPKGKGTSSSPYLIATLDNLYWITQHEKKWDCYYKQTNDIDASSTKSWKWTDENGNAATGLKSIGNGDQSFTGSYDGQKYSISNLYINRRIADNVGLFGHTYDATIKNLTLVDVDITSYYDGDEPNISYDYIGALIGASTGTLVENCHSSGSVSGGGSVGGLTGYNYFSDNSATKLKNSSSSCTVNGVSWVGGLVGTNNGASIIQCSSTGNVTGESNVENETNSYIGGFIGLNYNYSEVYECYSRGNVSGEEYVGGFIGKNTDSNIKDSYCTGDVSGTNFIGGFIGFNSYDDNEGVIVQKCYSIGNVTGTNNVGGLIGKKDEYSSDILYSFWDIETSNMTSSSGGTGKTTNEMQTQSTYTNAGWDFDNIWEIIPPSSATSNDELAKVNTDGNYPQLQFQSEKPLPVELTEFTTSVVGKNVELHWTTATEINNYGFSIEKKTQTGNWYELGFVAGSGNSNSINHYSYIDKTVGNGVYYYRLKLIDINGAEKYSNIEKVRISKPEEFVLLQNYPNPFNPTTVIEFSLPEKSFTSLKVYNILGQEVSILLNEIKTAGSYKINFNASKLISGIYYYQLSSGSKKIVKKMMLLK